MVMPLWYDKLVEAKMHKVTQLSEAETAKEIAEVTEGVFIEQGFTDLTKSEERKALIERAQPKKKRGRPLGSKNKPKDAKA